MDSRLFYDNLGLRDSKAGSTHKHGAKPVIASRRAGSVPTNLKRSGVSRSSTPCTQVLPPQRQNRFSVPADQVMSKENLPGHVIASLPGHTFGEASDTARRNTPQSHIFSESALHLSGDHANVGNKDKAARFGEFSQYYATLVGTVVSTENPAIIEASESCNFYTGLTDKQALELKTLVKNKIAAKNAFDEVSVVQFLTSLYYSNQSLNRVGLIELIEDLGAAYVVTDPLRLIKERNKRRGLNIYGDPLELSGTQQLQASDTPRKPQKKIDALLKRLDTPDSLASASRASTSVATSTVGVSVGVGSINVHADADDKDEMEVEVEQVFSGRPSHGHSLRLNLLPNAPPLLHESLLVSSQHRSPSMGGTPRPENRLRAYAAEGSIPPQSDIDLVTRTPRPTNEPEAAKSVYVQFTNDATSPIHKKHPVNINYAEASGFLEGPDKSGISLVAGDYHHGHHRCLSNSTMNYLTGLEGESTVGYDGPPDINREPYVMGRFIDPYEN